MEDKTFCENIVYNGEIYGVFIENETNLVWVNKRYDPSFGEENYGNFKARNKKEALIVAKTMLESAGK